MKDRILMPIELTAENGAKKLLMDEFFETRIMAYESCCESGYDDNLDACESCGGSGDYQIRVYISWHTIKQIYAKCALHLGERVDN